MATASEMKNTYRGWKHPVVEEILDEYDVDILATRMHTSGSDTAPIAIGPHLQPSFTSPLPGTDLFSNEHPAQHGNIPDAYAAASTGSSSPTENEGNLAEDDPESEPYPDDPLSWTCTVCDETVNVFTRDDHLLSKAHLNKERKLAPKLVAQVATEAAPMWYCPLCEKSMTIFSQDPHLLSKTHLRNERKFIPKTVLEQPTADADPLWYCTLCEKSMTIFSQDGHLNSKGHLRKQRSTATPVNPQETLAEGPHDKDQTDIINLLIEPTPQTPPGLVEDADEEVISTFYCLVCASEVPLDEQVEHEAIGIPCEVCNTGVHEDWMEDHLEEHAYESDEVSVEYPEAAAKLPDTTGGQYPEIDTAGLQIYCTTCNDNHSPDDHSCDGYNQYPIGSSASVPNDLVQDNPELAGADDISENKTYQFPPLVTTAPTVEVAKTFYCVVCQRDYPLVSQKTHLEGKKHAQTAKEVQRVEELSRPAEISAKSFFCAVCERDFVLNDQKTHLQGRKHAEAAKEAQRIQEISRLAKLSPKTFFCAVCQRDFKLNDQKTHLEGRKHAEAAEVVKHNEKKSKPESLRTAEVFRTQKHRELDTKDPGIQPPVTINPRGARLTEVQIHSPPVADSGDRLPDPPETRTADKLVHPPINPPVVSPGLMPSLVAQRKLKTSYCTRCNTWFDRGDYIKHSRNTKNTLCYNPPKPAPSVTNSEPAPEGPMYCRDCDKYFNYPEGYAGHLTGKNHASYKTAKLAAAVTASQARQVVKDKGNVQREKATADCKSVDAMDTNTENGRSESVERSVISSTANTKNPPVILAIPPVVKIIDSGTGGQGKTLSDVLSHRTSEPDNNHALAAHITPHPAPATESEILWPTPNVLDTILPSSKNTLSKPIETQKPLSATEHDQSLPPPPTTAVITTNEDQNVFFCNICGMWFDKKHESFHQSESWVCHVCEIVIHLDSLPMHLFGPLHIFKQQVQGQQVTSQQHSGTVSGSGPEWDMHANADQNLPLFEDSRSAVCEVCSMVYHAADRSQHQAPAWHCGLCYITIHSDAQEQHQCLVTRIANGTPPISQARLVHGHALAEPGVFYCYVCDFIFEIDVQEFHSSDAWNCTVCGISTHAEWIGAHLASRDHLERNEVQMRWVNPRACRRQSV